MPPDTPAALTELSADEVLFRDSLLEFGRAEVAPLVREMDDRAIACFDQALVDVGLDRDDRLRRVLHDYFAWATTTTMSRYHDSADDVPDGLTVPRWSWDGLQP